MACALGLPGCSSTTATTGPTTVTGAYRSAHPSGNLPELLSTVPADLSGLARLIGEALPPGVPVIMPARLPDGFGVSAPYIAVGDGSALPNPESWDDGYRIAFTDGERLVSVAVNLTDPPGAEGGTATSMTVAGRRLSFSRDGQMIVLSTPPSEDWRLSVIGLGMSKVEVAGFAATLRPVR